MRIRINDLGARIGADGKLHSIGCTSILLEWMEGSAVLYRMLLDCGMKSKYENGETVLDTTNLERIKNVFEDKVQGFESGVQAMALSHCHEDHMGGYPWFYSHCKNKDYIDREGNKKKGIPVNGVPLLYMTSSTWNQFLVFQDDLYDIFAKNAIGSGYEWDKGIINEIGIYKRDKLYHSEQDVYPKPLDFDIKIRFLPAGHIVFSAMI